ncbi:MAG TPA: chaperone protein ClpB, partial [Polyangiaceae bacterium]
RPEFLNRIDDVVLFRPLSKKDLRGIVDIQLRRLEKLVADRELKVVLSEEAKMRLVDIGYEPAFGARPLRRAILKQVQDPLAEEVLRGGYPPGSIVKVELSGDDFVFAKA